MEIYLLMKLEKDAFGDKPEGWEPISWTDDLNIAIKWRDGSHKYERFDFKRIPKRSIP